MTPFPEGVPNDAEIQRLAAQASHAAARVAEARQRQGSARRVYDIVRSSIRHGEVKPVLNEASIIAGLDSSRTSVRAAMQQLADDGMVERRRRVGTHVVGKITVVGAHPPGSPGDPVDGGEHYSAYLVERRRVAPGNYLRTRLQIDDEPVWLAEHLLAYDDDIVAVRAMYVADTDGIDDDLLLDPLVAFEDRFGVAYGGIRTTVEALKGDARTCQLLGVAPDSAVLVRETLVRDVEGRPRELAFTHFAGNRVALDFGPPFDETPVH